MSSYGALDQSESGKQFDRKKTLFIAAVAVLGAVLMVQMVRYGASEVKVHKKMRVHFRIPFAV